MFNCERSRSDVFALEIANDHLSLISTIEPQSHQYVVETVHQASQICHLKFKGWLLGVGRIGVALQQHRRVVTVLNSTVTVARAHVQPHVDVADEESRVLVGERDVAPVAGEDFDAHYRLLPQSGKVNVDATDTVVGDVLPHFDVVFKRRDELLPAKRPNNILQVHRRRTCSGSLGS